ncbi:hypothetical protein [Brevibacillus porteri]|uniref:N-acetyltransferase domain-containing protein n=1 Tax=Brevibacillus porteri TaxID=2126350 RepID=A0ABX5FTU1_9BACL|nr:hypothetical protein [Brevibacillus porteri]MED1798402.1 hypothetical protein [Brevibacillus porteri]MED2129309.1 hypothetical protein [Brevibacillus porteri]MED2748558.1 hypothetical protein [Brevibacillus porteri]MED2816965.1 hypothetical protein [Brevibacillus porteri]MED2896070.1 hypothetical protein [Brevibacillus porteri]
MRLTVETSDDFKDYIRLECNFSSISGWVRGYNFKEEQISFLNFEYILEGGLYINDIKSEYKKRGHARLMNKLLVDSASSITQDILAQGYKKSISFIRGEIVPRDANVTSKELKTIYEKLGYQIEDNSKILLKLE